jgi:hypothetical protein
MQDAQGNPDSMLGFAGLPNCTKAERNISGFSELSNPARAELHEVSQADGRYFNVVNWTQPL